MALARALVAEPELLMLDEPASGLDASELSGLSELIDSLHGTVAIMLVEHHVDFVTSVCDRVVALDFGRVIATGAPPEVQQDPQVQEAYLGQARSVSSRHSPSATSRSWSSRAWASIRTTVGALLKTVSKGKASGKALIEGAITDGYLPSHTDTANPWIQLFMKVHAQYDSSAPLDGNLEYGTASAYALVQALQAAGKNLTRQSLVNAVQQFGATWKGPGLVPFRYSQTNHGGYGGAEMGQVRGGKIVLFGGLLTTDPTAGTPITPYTTAQPAPPANGIPTGP